MALGTYGEVITASSNITISPEDRLILVDATSGSKTVTLPPAQLAGIGSILIFTIKRITDGVNSCTIQVLEGDTIDGSASVTLDNLNDAITVMSDTQNYRITGRT